MSERDGVKVAKLLRNSILRLELRPGVILDEAELGARLNVSRTPVREAIIQLIADGLVVREGRKAKVAPLDFDDVPKLYDALLISSRLVHRQAALNRIESNLRDITREMERFEALTATGNGVERSEVNVAFHKAISASADNRYISDFYEQALFGTIRLSRACFSKRELAGREAGTTQLSEHLNETVRQHRRIYEAIEAQDMEAADATAIEHYQLTKKRVTEVLFSQTEALTELEDLTLDSWDVPELSPETSGMHR
ncbi:GntR family transcriptional regulator [Paracoccus saliphilus]|uniref:GntR family transcriptional regulator n=1 Tax=Paracoccus saliphilus TaxID=405559 RepID=A0AA45W514_9RHOB|nr:GntR family transcriptional regulator [Paracoccus saliphilus]WCR02127.1 GntR family transcriptional regulator [Paracoccus saliphilus]SIS90296.1 transcriptional regulator, GntR family [Paracoccus saliphilus]